MTSALKLAALSLCLLLLAVPGAWACDAQSCFISAPELGATIALRASPSADAPVVCYFFTGVGLDILEHEGDFLAVRLEGVPGFAARPEDKPYQDIELEPHGYVSDADVYKTRAISTDTLLELLPIATVRTGEDGSVILLSEPKEGATPQAVVLPGVEYRLAGRIDGFDLLIAGGVWGYLPQEQVQSGARSYGFPADYLWERPDYFDATFPFRYALVNPEREEDVVALLPSPDEHAEPIATYAVGTVVQILSADSPYCRVRTFEHEGYMERACLQIDGEKGKQALTGIRDYRPPLSLGPVAMYTFPDVRAPKIGDITENCMDILGIAGDWYFVRVSYREYWAPYTCQGFIRPIAVADQSLGTLGTRTYGVVMLPEGMTKLPLYAAPSSNSEVLGSYFQTTQVEVLEAVGASEEFADELEWLYYTYWPEDGYFRVRVDGQEGCMRACYMAVLRRSDPSTW